MISGVVFYEGQSENSDSGLITFLSIILYDHEISHTGAFTLCK